MEAVLEWEQASAALRDQLLSLPNSKRETRVAAALAGVNSVGMYLTSEDARAVLQGPPRWRRVRTRLVSVLDGTWPVIPGPLGRLVQTATLLVLPVAGLLAALAAPRAQPLVAWWWRSELIAPVMAASAVPWFGMLLAAAAFAWGTNIGLRGIARPVAMPLWLALLTLLAGGMLRLPVVVPFPLEEFGFAAVDQGARPGSDEGVLLLGGIFDATISRLPARSEYQFHILTPASLAGPRRRTSGTAAHLWFPSIVPETEP